MIKESFKSFYFYFFFVWFGIFYEILLVGVLLILIRY